MDGGVARAVSRRLAARVNPAARQGPVARRGAPRAETQGSQAAPSVVLAPVGRDDSRSLPGRWVHARVPGDRRPHEAGFSWAGPFPPELEAYRRLGERLSESGEVTEHDAHLADEAAGLSVRPGFDVLVSLPQLRFAPFDYQLRAAEAVLRRMRGRAILADEVGLGKTIEAGLVATELRLRGLARRVLVLAPAGLVEQWREEFDRKFALPSVLAGREWSGATAPGDDDPIVIASLASARRRPLSDALAAEAWDLVIADEAHHLKNPRSASARLVRSLRTHFLLALTATPVENRLDDLFQLASLVRPGHLGTPGQFRARHGAASADRPRDLAGLQERMHEVMVRHRRSEVALWLPRRLAETRRVLPGPDEADLYRRVTERVRVEGRGAAPGRRLALRALARLAGSSPRALAPSLDKLGFADLATAARRVPETAKARALIEVLARHVERGEKVVVFCAFRETLAFLGELVAASGVPTAVYHGSLPRRDKDAVIRAFAGEVPVLLSTEAAGEGRNIQFCHVMVNFDLPWNPMQIEQRLGRVHRIGQEHDVVLTNLVTRGTIEERMLAVLEAKLNLFELVVGELDMILGRIEGDFDFESAVFHALVESNDDEDLDARLHNLGEDLALAKAAYLSTRHSNDDLVPHEAAG